MMVADEGSRGEPPSPRRRVSIAAGVFVAAVLGGAAVWAISNQNDKEVDGISAVDGVPTVLAGAGTMLPDNSLLFRNTALGPSFGKVAVVASDDRSGVRTITDLSCERVHFRNGRGVCLEADRGFDTTYRALVFDEQFSVMHEIDLAGAPSRVRVSPGGTIAGATVFVSGHAYSDVPFSTQTVLIDTVDGDVVADLEVDFAVLRDGDVWIEVDFNFWGVTWVDDNEFFATLGTGGETYLVRGDVGQREMAVLDSGVECPSLSPSGTHIAFKSTGQTEGAAAVWQIAVLELATAEVTILAETRSVDDQVAWLDNKTVLYGLPVPDSPAETDTWAVPADGSGQPELYLSRAWSTSIAG